jgi:hypothetical protein
LFFGFLAGHAVVDASETVNTKLSEHVKKAA